MPFWKQQRDDARRRITSCAAGFRLHVLQECNMLLNVAASNTSNKLYLSTATIKPNLNTLLPEKRKGASNVFRLSIRFCIEKDKLCFHRCLSS